MAVNGVSFKRCFELAKLLHKPLFALRDNDGHSIEHWQNEFGDYLEKGKRYIFIGDPDLGNTLEPQIESAENNAMLKQIFPKVGLDPIALWMQKTGNKTKSALAIAESEHTLNPPVYFKEAFTAIEKIIGAQP